MSEVRWLGEEMKEVVCGETREDWGLRGEGGDSGGDCSRGRWKRNNRWTYCINGSTEKKCK